MKLKLSFCLAICILPLFLFAQNRAKFHHIIKRSRVLSGNLPLVYNDGVNDHFLYPRVTPAGTLPPDPNFQVCSDLQAIVTLSSTGTANVDIFSFTSPSPNPNCIGNTTPLGSFRLNIARSNLGDPSYVYKIPFKAKTWSVATVPFRYRFKTDSSFSTVTTNLSASLNYGWTIWGESRLTHRMISHYSIIGGPFVGVTSIDLKKSTVKNPYSWATDRTNIGISYGASFTLARNNFGVVLSIGADHVLGKQNKQWSYQDKPWIGLGVNTSLGLF
jgi:hypothetical protein